MNVECRYSFPVFACVGSSIAETYTTTTMMLKMIKTRMMMIIVMVVVIVIFIIVIILITMIIHTKGDKKVSVLVASPGNCDSRQMTSTANLPHPSPEHASFTGRAISVVIRRGLVLLQLNAEGISKAIIQVIEHIATNNLAKVILLQETHVTNPDVLNIPGYSLDAHTSSRIHGVATFMQCSTKWRDIASSTPAEEVEWVTTEVDGVNVTTV